jgi:UDP:flavonoid glycosyltransferase YjiC (YdhE family)
MFRATVGKPLNAARRELGLPLWRKGFMGSYLAGDANIGMFPRWFGPPTPDWPKNVRQVGFPSEPSAGELPVELRAFLDAGDPPLVFTPGPAGYQHSDEFFRHAGDACRHLGQRGVFVTRGIELNAPLPDRVIACSFAPFQRLFAAASLVVHHGGIGTVSHAFAAGRPQLITPFGFDQPDHGYRVRRLGAGGALQPAKLDGATLAEAITRIDTDATRAVCRTLQEKVAGDGDAIAGAVAEIEALVA